MQAGVEQRVKNSIRTDLAMEIRENLQGESPSEIPGVSVDIQQAEPNITTTWVEITNQEGAKAMGKPIGNYITLESPIMKENEPEAHEGLAKHLAESLARLHNLGPDALVLVAGLGNRQVTPDALGPLVCEKILVTRHLAEVMPEALEGGLRGVSALAPGVMGITGIETAEIIKGVAEKIKPDLIIAIDALAARSTSRINATVQISDAGVNPGAGLGNRRTPINQGSMGVPVIAMGVPTVVDAATLVNDTMDRLLNALPGETTLHALEDEERYGLITDVLENYNMFVTPKDIDAVIARLANIVANALNIALHPGITKEDINRFTAN